MIKQRVVHVILQQIAGLGRISDGRQTLTPPRVMPLSECTDCVMIQRWSQARSYWVKESLAEAVKRHSTSHAR